MEIFAWIGILVVILTLSFSLAFCIALIEGNGSADNGEWVVGLGIAVVFLCIILASTISNPKMFHLTETVSVNTVEEKK